MCAGGFEAHVIRVRMSVPTTMIGVMDAADELETRAALYRVALQAAQLHRTLRSLPPHAAKLTTGGDADSISRLASRMLWASTADLNQRREYALAQRVVERAAELEGEL
jgi:hypothetical protein